MLARIYNFEEINEEGYKIRELSLIDDGSARIAQALSAVVAENPLRKALAVVADLPAQVVLADALKRLRIDSVSVYVDDDDDTQQCKIDEAINAHGRLVLIVCDELILSDKTTQ
jgi:hypothetical protein